MAELPDAGNHHQEIPPAPTEAVQDDPGRTPEDAELARCRSSCQEFADRTRQKLELFLHASSNKNLQHRRFGLSHLQKLDPKEFMKILLATLESLPKTPKEPYWVTAAGGRRDMLHLVHGDG